MAAGQKGSKSNRFAAFPNLSSLHPNTTLSARQTPTRFYRPDARRPPATEKAADALTSFMTTAIFPKDETERRLTDVAPPEKRGKDRRKDDTADAAKQSS